MLSSHGKLALVTALYKNRGSSSAPAHYRTISLLKPISKRCERILIGVLYTHVTPALTHAQSGYQHCDATQYQVTLLVQDIIMHRHKDHAGVEFFVIDLAFDTVWHKAKAHLPG